VPSFAMPKRRDPWWEADGPAARGARRRRRLRSGVALIAAVVAVAGAAFAWSLELGIAQAAGLHVALRLG
jgi:hypothetical protein